VGTSAAAGQVAGAPAAAGQVVAEQAPTVPGAPVSAAVAVPTLAKLAAVRLRDANDPAGEEAPSAPVQSELNVWAARVVPTNAQQGGTANTARMPGQMSPWFKPPRDPRPEPQETDPVVQVPLAAVAGAGAVATEAGQPMAAQPTGSQSAMPQGPVAQAAHGPQGPRGPRPVRLEQLVPEAAAGAEPSVHPTAPQVAVADGQSVGIGGEPVAEFMAEAPIEAGAVVAPAVGQEEQDRRPAASPLDPDVCFEALIGYIDQYGHQPQPKRFAQYLSAEYGVVGSRPDGSVNLAEVDQIWEQLQERYIASGRD
jgi:hypothetical protein